MYNKIINFFYYFDIMGPNPKLYIFNNERYKSIFSLLFSFLIIFIILLFILYSLINYIQNDRPSVVYSKSNDKDEQRKVYLKDTLIMFQLTDFLTFKKLDESIAYFEAELNTIYATGVSETLPLKVEKCKLGQNLNPKYEQFFKERFSTLSFEYNQYDKNIEDFFCINDYNSDISLFYQPNIGFSNIIIKIIIKNQNLYTPEKISLMFVYESNLINHEDKTSPISEGISYQIIQSFSSSEYTIINYNFQYLKYETDDGLFFDDIKLLKGITFFDMNYYRNNQAEYNLQNNLLQFNSSQIGTMMLFLNKSNYDYYRRTYKKLQSLLAEIMSIVSLLLEIGRQISSFLNEKKMSIDIIKKLFEIENSNLSNKPNRFLINSDRIKMVPEKVNNSFKLNDNNSNSNITSKNIIDDSKDKKNKKEIVLNTINIFNIIKSFCCCNSNKDKLISLCHDIVIKDMCVETIVGKFYNLGRIYSSIIDIEKYNLGLNKEPKFIELNSIINSIHNQMKKSNIKYNNRNNK